MLVRLQKLSGTAPCSALLFNQSSCKFERLPRVEGIVPLRRLPESTRRRSSLKLPNWLGIAPLSALPANTSERKSAKGAQLRRNGAAQVVVGQYQPLKPGKRRQLRQEWFR